MRALLQTARASRIPWQPRLDQLIHVPTPRRDHEVGRTRDERDIADRHVEADPFDRGSLRLSQRHAITVCGMMAGVPLFSKARETRSTTLCSAGLMPADMVGTKLSSAPGSLPIDAT